MLKLPSLGNCSFFLCWMTTINVADYLALVYIVIVTMKTEEFISRTTSSATAQKIYMSKSETSFFTLARRKNVSKTLQTANDLILGFFMKLAERALPIQLSACNENKTMYM